MKNKFFIKSIVIIFAFTFVLSGCSLIVKKTEPIKPPISPGEQSTSISTSTEQISQAVGVSVSQQLAVQNKIKKFNNFEELKEFLEQSSVSTYSSSVMRGLGVDTWGGMEVDSVANMDLEEVAPMAAKTMEAGEAEATVGQATGMGGSQDFSQTNVQVEGVDEADIIKTDGKYIYAVAKNDLYIVDAYPADKANILAKIEFKSRPHDIYINDDYLAIYGRDDVFYQTEIYKRFRRRSNYTYLKVFDIKDRKNPKQVRDLDFEGNYLNSRMIGDYVYFVTSNYNFYYIDGEPIIPRIIENGEVLANSSAAEDRYFTPEVYYFDIPYNSYNFTTVTAVNVKDASELINGEVYLLSGNQNMYVSQNNIYITYTKYISEYQLEMEVIREMVYPLLSEKERDKIIKIEKAENYILTPDEKRRKIMQIIERFISTLSEEEQERLEKELEEKMKQKYEDISKELEKTVIHKIAIDKNMLEYKTFGEVTGQVLNQFSMDERDGYFRIATTKSRTWSRYEEESRKSYNNLYVLDGDLKMVGALEGLAEDERIYSVRFMQNRAYLVTFKQMDPLFVIDLADPKNPKVLGKLKIPGYSDYLHPYDDNTLIGLGKDTAESEWGGISTKGLKLSLFDVSNVSDPEEIDTYIMGDAGSDSIALRDHKAFLFSRDKNLLSIPVSIRESLDGRSWGKLTFSGAAVFLVDKNGFELKGRIDHSDGGQPADSDYWRGYSYYDNTVKRALYIENVLYTFSNRYLKMNKLEDLELVKNLELKKLKSGEDDDFEIIN